MILAWESLKNIFIIDFWQNEGEREAGRDDQPTDRAAEAAAAAAVEIEEGEEVSKSFVCFCFSLAGMRGTRLPAGDDERGW